MKFPIFYLYYQTIFKQYQTNYQTIDYLVGEETKGAVYLFPKF